MTADRTLVNLGSKKQRSTLAASLLRIETELASRTGSVEVVYLLSSKGQQLGRFVGEENRCMFVLKKRISDHLRHRKDIIITHNHPDSPGDNIAVSIIDLITAMNMNLKEIRAVGQDKVCSIIRGKEGWGERESVVKDEMQKFCLEVSGNSESLTEEDKEKFKQMDELVLKHSMPWLRRVGVGEVVL